MLDAHQAFRRYADQDIDIYWGAYLGTPDEILASGPIAEAAPRIERLRAEARERKGWIMDTYLLRRHRRTSSGHGAGHTSGPAHCAEVAPWCESDLVTVAEETSLPSAQQPPCWIPAAATSSS